MTLVVATGLCVLMGVLVLRRPLASLLLYGMTATYADGFGISEWLSPVVFYDQTMDILFLILFTRAVFRLFGKTEILSPTRANAVASLVVVAWCLLSVLMGGASFLGAFSIFPYLALPYVIVWVAFADASTSSRYLTGLVVAQSALAMVVLLIPGLGFLQGNSYVRLPSGEVGSVGKAQLVLPNAATLKGVAGDHYAQFHNPNLLGFYGVAAIAVGLYLLIHHQSRYRLGGIAVMVAGVFMWTNSLTRGPMLGLLFMLVVWWLSSRDSHRSQMKTAVSLVVGIIGILATYALAASSGVLDFLIPSRDDISVTARFDGYSEAWRIITQSPVFGVDVTFQWDPLLRPHFIGLLFGAEYGVLAGVFITWIVFIGAGLLVLRVLRNKHVLKAVSLLVATLFGIMVGIAATNNFAGPVLFGAILGHLLILGGAERSLSAALDAEPESVNKVLRAPRPFT